MYGKSPKSRPKKIPNKMPGVSPIPKPKFADMNMSVSNPLRGMVKTVRATTKGSTSNKEANKLNQVLGNFSSND